MEPPFHIKCEYESVKNFVDVSRDNYVLVIFVIFYLCAKNIRKTSD